MGNSESKSEYSQTGLKYFKENFEFVKKLTIDDYNEFKIFREKETGCLISTVDETFDISRDSKYFLEDIIDTMNLDHPGLLRLVGYERIVSDGYCGIYVGVIAYTEWYDHDLLIEINDRVSKNMPFEENELFYILRSLVDVNAYLQRNGLSHGDLRPQFIKLSPNGNVKIYPHWMLSTKKNGFTKAWIGDHDPFLSPEQFHELNQENKFPTFSESKGDVFTLGITLIYCGILESPLTIYNDKEFVIDYNVISKFLNKMLQIYSIKLIDHIIILTEFDHLNRKTFIELQDLEYYQGRIGGKENALTDTSNNLNQTKKFVRKIF